jgi:hypothetical protein
MSYFESAEPVVMYEFIDRLRLERYFNGVIPQGYLAESVAVHYFSPGARQADPLALLDDLKPDDEPPGFGALFSRPRMFDRVTGDFSDAARTAAHANWLEAGLIGAEIVLASRVLD